MESAIERVLTTTAQHWESTMERREVIDLWGNTVVLEVSEAKGRKPTPRKGYAGIPGTGPEGETCGTCEHRTGTNTSKVYYKCALMRAHWTGGQGTDILVRSPACRKWEREKE